MDLLSSFGVPAFWRKQKAKQGSETIGEPKQTRARGPSVLRTGRIQEGGRQGSGGTGAGAGGAAGAMTSFARKSSTIASSHGKGVLRQTVSSPAAAAVVNDVHELVSRLDSRSMDPLLQHTNSSPRQYVVHDDIVVDIRSEPHCSSDATSSAHTSSAHSQHATPLSGTPSADPVSALCGARGAIPERTPIPDGPVYALLRQEVANGRLDDAAVGRRSPSSINGSPYSGSPRNGSPGAAGSPLGAGVSYAQMAAQEKRVAALEGSLDEAKTSNRLLSRALAAVQQRLKQTETEREQLRRERDHFRSLALRFPFTLSVSGLRPSFQHGEN